MLRRQRRSRPQPRRRQRDCGGVDYVANDDDDDASRRVVEPSSSPRRRLTIAERVALVQLWHRCEGNVRRVLSLWRQQRRAADGCGDEKKLCGRTVTATVRRFSELGSVLDRARSGRVRSVRVRDVIGRVRESVRREPMLSTRKRASLLNVSRSSLMRIQKLDLGVRAYKVQMAHQLLPLDTERRLILSRRVLREIDRDGAFVRRLIMGDEAHFDLSGGVFNRQNVRFWGTENPRIVRPRAAHSVRVTVWCGVSSNGILGPYFFEDGEQRTTTVSVTGERYCDMLRDYVEPLLRSPRYRLRDGGSWWWQQDGATAHTARETMTLLRRMFGAKRIISRGAAVPWPPRSPDLSAADYFLWGYLKDRVYRGGDGDDDGGGGGVAGRRCRDAPPPPPRTRDQLKRAIEREVARLNEANAAPLRLSVMENFATRASVCLREGGGHLRDVIFRTTHPTTTTAAA